MTFKEFVKELNGEGVEGELIKNSLYSLITSFIILGILYFIKLKNISNFMPKYGYYLVTVTKVGNTISAQLGSRALNSGTFF